MFGSIMSRVLERVNELKSPGEGRKSS
jgi:hypothetical protein